MTIWAIIPLISCLAYIALLIMTLPSARRRIHKIFALYLSFAAVWSFTSFMLHLNAFPDQALFWNEILTAALVGTLVSYYHFIRAYCNKPAGYGVYLGYLMAVVLLTLCLSSYIVQYAYVIDGVLYHSLGYSIYLIGAISLIYIGAGLYLLINKYHVTTDLIERNRTSYLIAGWSIVTSVSYTNLIPAVAGLPLDQIGNVVNVLIISYAVSRFHMLDIRFVLREGLVYSSLTIFLTSLYLLLLFILQSFFHDWTGFNSIALAAGFALLIAILSNPLMNILQRGIDRVFFRETFDYRQLLLHFSNRINNVLDLNELSESIMDPIARVFHTRQVSLLFPRNESGDFTTQFVRETSPRETVPELKLNNGSPIVNWLASEGKALSQESIEILPQFKSLWETEKTLFNDSKIKLLCPIRSKGELIGILAVGEKQSGTIFTSEEIDLLMTIANEAAIAIENARMLDSLRNEQLRADQLLGQVVQVQEEERERISADLHDGVAQWLAAASYQIQTINTLLSRNGGDKAAIELTTMENTIDRSLKELRRVVIGLRPPALDELGLRHSLRHILEDLKKDEIECIFKETGMSVRLPSSIEIAVFRIVQETLNNIRKHANASQVYLHLHLQSNQLLVEIRDNGKGFDLYQTLDSAISVGHMGLLGMKKRAETLGGAFKIKTEVGMGTIITLELPIPSQMEGDS
ncbi:histidine kinase [Chloroflexota bacterium]